ncbi:hypothetical protein [Geobacter sp. SVR]|uniref:hypothetical protein n=1 Tax=Geobacter sp. SVR TaxID=2495594 RepID=UPI00143F0108|nr:hypothetical protein [Geobacter sp. SVR]BCS52652.1 hypothetical protein GSVR_09600 [Geobacter sp. SVR]GCF83910.1 hypothetical protein GSbR_05100 [Geobacter sp. SVR]
MKVKTNRPSSKSQGEYVLIVEGLDHLDRYISLTELSIVRRCIDDLLRDRAATADRRKEEEQ